MMLGHAGHATSGALLGCRSAPCPAAMQARMALLRESPHAAARGCPCRSLSGCTQKQHGVRAWKTAQFCVRGS